MLSLSFKLTPAQVELLLEFYFGEFIYADDPDNLHIPEKSHLFAQYALSCRSLARKKLLRFSHTGGPPEGWQEAIGACAEITEEGKALARLIVKHCKDVCERDRSATARRLGAMRSPAPDREDP